MVNSVLFWTAVFSNTKCGFIDFLRKFNEPGKGEWISADANNEGEKVRRLTLIAASGVNCLYPSKL